MKIWGQVGNAFASNMERAWAPSIRALPKEEIPARSQVEAMLFIDEWGVRGIRINSKGQIALVPDESTKLQELVESSKLLHFYQEKKQSTRVKVYLPLKSPNERAKEGAMDQYYHTSQSLDPRRHSGVEFFDSLNNLRLTIYVEE